jgi:hypothetical protein
MSNQERRQKIEEAIELIKEASNLLDDAVRGTSEARHFKAYGEYGIKQLLGYANPYDRSLYDLSDSFLKSE